jgi:DNA-binding MarR family transcriptional regulator
VTADPARGTETSPATLRHACAETLLRVSPRFCRLMARRFHAAQAGDGLTPAQLLLLERLSEGPATAGTLAREALIHPSSVTQLTDALVTQGLVTRDRGREDRRAVVVALTPAGRAARDRVRAAAIERFAAQLSQLADDELHRLFSALVCIEALLERAEPSGAPRARPSPADDSRA